MQQVTINASRTKWLASHSTTYMHGNASMRQAFQAQGLFLFAGAQYLEYMHQHVTDTTTVSR